MIKIKIKLRSERATARRWNSAAGLQKVAGVVGTHHMPPPGEVRCEAWCSLRWVTAVISVAGGR